jgi:chitinase
MAATTFDDDIARQCRPPSRFAPWLATILLASSIAAHAQAAATIPGMPADSSENALPDRVVAYFTQWSHHDGHRLRDLVDNGSAARLTHLHYAFGNVRDGRCEVGVQQAFDPATGTGGDARADYAQPYAAADSVDGSTDAPAQPLRGYWNQLRELKQRYPRLKVLVSLGGWTLSHGFADAARPGNREAFVASCIDAYIRGNLPLFEGAGGPGAAAGVFDGIDIDWEFPGSCGLSCGTPEDRADFTALLAEFRRQLDAQRPGLLLTAAVGAGLDQIRATDPAQYQRSLDYINVMAYGYHGPGEPLTNFHAALYAAPGDPAAGDARRFNIHDTIQALLARGVPRRKLVLGIAAHGRGWQGVPDRDHGLYQPGTPAPGSLGPGLERYRVLQVLPYPRHDNRSARAHWIYGSDTFWSFDDPATVAAKMAYVRAQGLGGGFLWETGGDDVQGSLLRAIADGLR